MKDMNIQVKLSDGIARIDFGRPDQGNMLTMSHLIYLAEKLQELGSDESVKVISLEPSGPDFCRGRDTQGEVREGLTGWETRERIMGRILDLYKCIADVPVPVVACVQGNAFGLGCALAGSCDITIASKDATFSLPEIEANIPPTLAMSGLLHKVSPKILTYLVYTADSLEADAAYTAGLVSKVYPAHEFKNSCDALLKNLTSRPRLTITTVKRYQSFALNATPSMASEYAGTLLALVRGK